MRRFVLAVLLVTTGALSTSCAPEFDPFHLANKFRILTIKTDPPELVIDPGLLTGKSSCMSLIPINPKPQSLSRKP